MRKILGLTCWRGSVSKEEIDEVESKVKCACKEKENISSASNTLNYLHNYISS